jgi:hypothetical protein
MSHPANVNLGDIRFGSIDLERMTKKEWEGKKVLERCFFPSSHPDSQVLSSYIYRPL